jgi:hypothetical protein
MTLWHICGKLERHDGAFQIFWIRALMENVGPLFGFCAFLALLGGVLGVIAPSIFRVGKMKENPSRKRIAMISGAAFVALFIVGVVLTPEPSPEQRAAWAAAEVKEKAELNRLEQEEKAKAALAAKQAADARAAEAESAKKKAKENLAGAINDIKIADRTCAKSVIEVGDRSKSARDRYALYGIVKDASENCLQAAKDLADINVPKELEETRKLCVDGELTRAMALSQNAAILDAGTGSPSELQAIEDGIADGQAKVLACMGILEVSARKVGIEINDLERSIGSAKLPD